MPIYSEWGNPQHTILHTCHRAQWTWDELRQHDSEVALQILNSIRHPVALVVDLCGSHWLQPEQFTSQMRAALCRYQHPAVQCILFVTRDPLTANLLNTVIEYAAGHGESPAYVLTSVTAAHQFVQHHYGGQIA